MADINTIAQQFTAFYYQTFDANRADLRPLYRDNSMLTWEGSPVKGVNDIIEKLAGMPFQKVTHVISTVDAQPSSPTISSLIVSVTGMLALDADKPIQFSQVFQLFPDGASFYVYNDVFRLNFAP